jgi:hypothetical protein
MRVIGNRTVKLADITANLFVRKELDQPWAIHLGELIEAGTEMKDPMEVVKDGDVYQLVEGRHRREGYDLAGVFEVKVKVLEFDNEVEMITYAYRANTGGKKPPTPADTEHTIMLLIDKGESMKAIGEGMGLPASITRKYVNEVKSRMARAQLQRAATAVTDGGLNIKQASEQYEVDQEKLKEVLSGRKAKHKHGVAEVQRTITSLHKSLSLKNGKLLKKVIEKYEDGDVTEKQVREIFRHVEDIQKKATRVTADYKRRFDAANGKVKEAAA